MRRGMNAMLCCAAAGMVALSGCAAAEQDVRTATAEQLANTAPDPWQQENTVVRTAPEGRYADGTYTGVGQGMDGIITVTLQVTDGKIHCSAMTQEGETPSVGGYEGIRDGKFAQMIDQAQGSDFDGISGATITTLGVREAVDDALSQAQM